MKILIKRIDGGVSVMQIIKPSSEQLEIAVENEIAKWPEEARNTVVSWRAVEDSAVPEDRTFREAWADITDHPSVDINMEKAKEIWKDKLRVERAPLLEKLDVEFMRNIEKGEDTSAISSKKQYLRDITKLTEIEQASTPEELKQITIKEIL